MRLLRWPLCGLLFGAVLLAGCSGSSVQEVRDWMASVKRETPVKIAPLSEPKKFIPFSYGASSEPDPFNASKLLLELAKAANNGGALAPDTRRRKEMLEAYPLDTLKMVGTMEKSGLRVALIQMDKAVFQVRTGSYLGQNFGRVTAISEHAVSIREVVQDPAGEWVERKAKLELQESKK
jgi:type IV pilus assembly protein PilP